MRWLVVLGMSTAWFGAMAPGAFGAALTLAPTVGPPGTKITATAAGFAAGDSLTFKVLGREVGDDTASASGAGVAKFRIPRDVDDDTVTVLVRSEATRKAARATFTVSTNWSQLGGGPGHNNVNRIERNLGPEEAVDLEQLWTSTSGADFIRSSPIKPGRDVYAMRSDGRVGAFNFFTGATNAWPGPIGAESSLSTPAVAGSYLFTANQQGLVRARNISTKAVVWTGNANGAVSGALTVAGTNVYAGSEDGKVYAFPISCSLTCTPHWVGTVGSAVRGGVAVANGRVYALGIDGRLRAFGVGCATGGGSCLPIETAPATNPGVDVEGQPVAAGGNVVLVSGPNVLMYGGYCLSCGPEWSGNYPGNSGGRSGPVVAGGKVFTRIGSRLVAFDAACGDEGATCAPVWQTRLAGIGLSIGGVAYADGVVWVAAGGRLLGFRADCGTGGATCRPLVSVPVLFFGETTPMIADGRIFIGVATSIAAFGVPDS